MYHSNFSTVLIQKPSYHFLDLIYLTQSSNEQQYRFNKCGYKQTSKQFIDL